MEGLAFGRDDRVRGEAGGRGGDGECACDSGDLRLDRGGILNAQGVGERERGAGASDLIGS